MTSAPTFEAISLCEATMPAFARVGTEIAPTAAPSSINETIAAASDSAFP